MFLVNWVTSNSSMSIRDTNITSGIWVIYHIMVFSITEKSLWRMMMRDLVSWTLRLRSLKEWRRILQNIIWLSWTVFARKRTIRKGKSSCFLPRVSNVVASNKLDSIKMRFPPGGTPYIDHTGVCGLYGWVFLGEKYVDMGTFWDLYPWV